MPNQGPSSLKWRDDAEAADVLTVSGKSKREALGAVGLIPALISSAVLFRWSDAVQSGTVPHRGKTTPPWDYVRRADVALAGGDHKLAVAFIEQAYRAFDECPGWCESPEKDRI